MGLRVPEVAPAPNEAVNTRDCAYSMYTHMHTCVRISDERFLGQFNPSVLENCIRR